MLGWDETGGRWIDLTAALGDTPGVDQPPTPDLDDLTRLVVMPEDDLTGTDHLVENTTKDSPYDVDTEALSQDPGWIPASV